METSITEVEQFANIDKQYNFYHNKHVRKSVTESWRDSMEPRRKRDFIATIRSATNTYTALSILAAFMLLGLIASAVAGYLVAHNVPILQLHSWKGLLIREQLFYVGVVALLFAFGEFVTVLNLLDLCTQRKVTETQSFNEKFSALTADYHTAALPEDHPEYVDDPIFGIEENYGHTAKLPKDHPEYLPNTQ